MPVKRKKNDDPLLFSTDVILKGHVLPIVAASGGHQVYYEHPNGRLYQGDSTDWLASLATRSVDLVFADPPYNIKKAEWDSFESQEAYIAWSLRWISQAARVLKRSGSMYVCGFSEILADIKHPASRLFKHCRWLIWHYRNKANLGKDWGRSHESILHFRKGDDFKLNVDDVRVPYGNHTLKYPSHPQAETSQYGNGANRDDWVPNPLGAKPKDVIEIPTTCNGMGREDPASNAEARRVVAASGFGRLPRGRSRWTEKTPTIRTCPTWSGRSFALESCR